MNTNNYLIIGGFIIAIGIYYFYFYKKEDNKFKDKLNTSSGTTSSGTTSSETTSSETTLSSSGTTLSSSSYGSINSITENNIIPIDCQVTDWSECNKPCGGGTKSRSILRDPLFGGKSCPALEESCNTNPCPVDCQVSNWSECNKPCGGGTRSRSILRDPLFGGKSCPALEESCNTEECKVPVDCQVSNWSECNKPCQIKSRSIVRKNINGGKPCPVLEETCNIDLCDGVIAYGLVIKKIVADNKPILINEIKIYDESNKPIVILPENVVMSSLLGNYTQNLAFDNNISTFAHTKDNDLNAFIAIKFEKEVVVRKIEINTGDIPRQSGHIIQLLNSKGQVVWSASLNRIEVGNYSHSFYPKYPTSYKLFERKNIPSTNKIVIGEKDWIYGSPDECAKKCNSDINCKGFSYDIDKSTFPDNRCYFTKESDITKLTDYKKTDVYLK